MSNYPPPHWPPSPHTWPPPMDRETEHRLTEAEVTLRHHGEAHQEHYETGDRHRDRLNLHEKAILALAGIVSIILQDKWPKLAALLKGLSP